MFEDQGVPIGQLDLVWRKWWQSHQRGNVCSEYNDSKTWVCTLEKGHRGPHVAHDSHNEVLDRWGGVPLELQVAEGL